MAIGLKYMPSHPCRVTSTSCATDKPSGSHSNTLPELQILNVVLCVYRICGSHGNVTTAILPLT